MLAELRLPCYASRPSFLRIQFINRISAKINQIASKSLEPAKKYFVSDGRINALKCTPHRSVQSRVALIEKSPRRGPCFSDEENT
jgi:hypothetical protein